MTSIIDIPFPPNFEHSDFFVPDFTSWDHPNTKWILNTFRSAASSRLAAMNKERPEIFGQVFQIPDTPEKITWDSADYEPMFKRSTVLYLRPLALAIYMRRPRIVKLLIENGLVQNTEVSYATDTKGRLTEEDSNELREIRPVTVAIRRNAIDTLPIIFSLKACGLRASDCFSLRYVSMRIDRCSKFKDALDYAIGVVRKNKILPVARIFDLLAFHCPGFCVANAAKPLCSKHGGPRCSLFQRLAKYLISEDGSNRLTLPLLQALEQLMRHRNFCKPGKTLRDIWLTQYRLSTISDNWSAMSVCLQDCLTTLALMIKLHEIFQEKSKMTILTQTTSLIGRMASCIGCRGDLLMCPIQEFQSSIDFLLDQSQKNSPELYNILEGGDTRLACRRSVSPKVLKTPSKPALKYLQGSLKEMTAFEKRRSRTPYSDTTVSLTILSDSGDMEPEEQKCTRCLVEAKEKSAHPTYLLPVQCNEENVITVVNPISAHPEFTNDSGPPTPSPIDRGTLGGSLDYYSVTENTRRTLECLIPSPTVSFQDTPRSENPTKTEQIASHETILSPKVLEETTFYEMTEDIALSQTVDNPGRYFPALYSTYQQGSETSRVSKTSSLTINSEARDILLMDTIESDTKVNLESVSATNRLRLFLDQSEREYVATRADDKPTPLYPPSFLPQNRRMSNIKSGALLSESADGCRSSSQPPGITLLNEEFRGPCSLRDVDQLIEQIARSAAATEDLMLSDVDSVLIDGMLQEYLSKAGRTSATEPTNYIYMKRGS